jgi:hypothetical protein
MHACLCRTHDDARERRAIAVVPQTMAREDGEEEEEDCDEDRHTGVVAAEARTYCAALLRPGSGSSLPVVGGSPVWGAGVEGGF